MGMRERFAAIYGRNAEKDAADKADAINVLNPDGRCGYCGDILTGGASTQFDHKFGDGGKWRKMHGIDGRTEIRWIKNGTHPEPQNRTFACACCNQEKSTMNADEFMQTEYIRRRRAIFLGE